MRVGFRPFCNLPYVLSDLVDCRCFRPTIDDEERKLDWTEVIPISETIREAAREMWKLVAIMLVERKKMEE